jgi:hypothetical protein
MKHSDIAISYLRSGSMKRDAGKERRYSYAEKDVDSSLHNNQCTDAQSSVHFDEFLL